MTTRLNGWMAGLVLAMAVGTPLSAVEPRDADEERPLPRLGFWGHFEQDWGMVVDHVEHDSPAARIGLKPGDVIQAVSDVEIRSRAHYHQLLRASRDRLRFRVDDVRTGRIVHSQLALRQRRGEVEAVAVLAAEEKATLVRLPAENR